MSEHEETDETQKTEIVIRKYGLLEPADWDRDCEDEMRLMDKLWNSLVDIHEDYTSRYLQEISRESEFSEARHRHNALVQANAPSAEVSAARRHLAIAQKDATRSRANELRALEAARREAVKIARQESGLWWGNYNAIVRSSERARNAAIRGGNTMRRRTAGGAGRITNTLQGGAEVEALFDGSLSQVMVRPPGGRAWNADSRGERRRLQRTTLSATVFVRDGERRTVSWPMIMHRPIPEDCLVKEVVVTRRRNGDRWLWDVVFMCTRRAGVPEPAVSRRLGIDIGWRRVPEGLRVATVVASGEPPRFIVLDSDLLASFALIDDLRGQLRSCSLKGLDLLQGADAEAYAPPFREALREFQSIPAKTAAHVGRFSRDAFFLEQPMELVGDDLLAWRRDYNRLSSWLRNHQRKVVGRRNHLYQNVVIELVDGASEIVVNDLKPGEMAVRRPAGAFFPNRAHHYRRIAAPSELTAILKLQSAKRGIAFTRHELASPLGCPACGSTSRRTRPDANPQVCASCDNAFDQDVAASEALLSPIAPTPRATVAKGMRRDRSAP